MSFSRYVLWFVLMRILQAELPAVVDPDSPEGILGVDTPSLHPAKRVDRNKRRALNGDFACTIHASSFVDGDGTRTFSNYDDESSCDGLCGK